MEVICKAKAFQRTCEEARQKGKSVGFVPTMGALHAGHLALIDALRACGCTGIAVSIFVNPLQFGPGEDLDRYPRTLDADLEACKSRGVDWVFVPSVEEMYPAGFSTKVRVEGLSEGLEGRFRPGHFEGVATVVAKLFALVGPCRAAFGRKDYQQLRLVERLVEDLAFPIEIVPVRTVREADGLAMSSRNRYLSPEERKRATGIVRGLRAAVEAFEKGERLAKSLEALARAPVEASFDAIDYVAVVDPKSLQPIDRIEEKALLAVAARIGQTRLIDNVVLGEERLL
ncbi:MAG: pantoate--beta-alanine ligase [Sandaracinaceae bacterium]|nr:pantoate--beta-alanine ligase [Sandaracinaceae bacterium]MDW8244948.1 pantoate--beta-alanine ligase [Sandaracinaceae bacterium]